MKVPHIYLAIRRWIRSLRFAFGLFSSVILNFYSKRCVFLGFLCLTSIWRWRKCQSSLRMMSIRLHLPLKSGTRTVHGATAWIPITGCNTSRDCSSNIDCTQRKLLSSYELQYCWLSHVLYNNITLYVYTFFSGQKC